MSNISLVSFPSESIQLLPDGSLVRQSIKITSTPVLSPANLVQEFAKEFKLVVPCTKTQTLVYSGETFYVVNKRDGIHLDAGFRESPNYPGYFCVGGGAGTFRIKLWWEPPVGTELTVITKCVHQGSGVYGIKGDGEDMFIFLTSTSFQDGLGYVPPLANFYNTGKVCTGIKPTDREVFRGQTPFVVNRLLLDRFDSSPFNTDLIDTSSAWISLYKATESGLKQVTECPNNPERPWNHDVPSVSNLIVDGILFAKP